MRKYDDQSSVSEERSETLDIPFIFEETATAAPDQHIQLQI